MIPKIIHQTGPADRARWPPVWSACQQSVLQRFPASEYEYRFWTDEDLERLVREKHPWFLSTFLAYPAPIYRADAGRYFVLYEHGGIYLDLDYEVMIDFHGGLSPDHVSLVESPFPNVERVQNSLMASPPRHPFWLEVFREMASTFAVFQHSVLDATGPRMMDRLLEEESFTRNAVRILAMEEYNPPPLDRVYGATRWRSFPDRPLYARHVCSASWR